MFGLFDERKIGLSLSIRSVIRNQNAGGKIHMHVLHQIGHSITYFDVILTKYEICFQDLSNKT